MTLHYITLQYITLHYIISHSIVLHYIISHYITDTKHTLISACVCSSECMYVCAFFWRCETITRSDVRISGASCLLVPERHVFFFRMLCSISAAQSATCSIWGTNREVGTEWPVFFHAEWFLQNYASVCSVAPLQQRYAVTLNRSSQGLGASFRRLHESEKSCSRKSCGIAWENLRVDQAESEILS